MHLNFQKMIFAVMSSLAMHIQLHLHCIFPRQIVILFLKAFHFRMQHNVNSLSGESYSNICSSPKSNAL